MLFRRASLALVLAAALLAPGRCHHRWFCCHRWRCCCCEPAPCCSCCPPC